MLGRSTAFNGNYKLKITNYKSTATAFNGREKIRENR